jgi:hypothetical protein
MPQIHDKNVRFLLLMLEIVPTVREIIVVDLLNFVLEVKEKEYSDSRTE